MTNTFYSTLEDALMKVANISSEEVRILVNEGRIFVNNFNVPNYRQVVYIGDLIKVWWDIDTFDKYNLKWEHFNDNKH